MKDITVTDIVAIIGCITGCASLLINFYKLISEKGKVHIKTNKFYNEYFERLPESKQLTKYQAMIYVEIVNSTPNPITIYDVDILLRDGHYSPDPCPVKEIELSQIQYGRATVSSITNMENVLITPYTIEPFHVFNDYIFLVNFLINPKETEWFFMTLRTTNGTKRLVGKIKGHKYEIN